MLFGFGPVRGKKTKLKKWKTRRKHELARALIMHGAVSFTLTDVDEYIASLPYTEDGIASNAPEHDKEDLVGFYEWLVKQNDPAHRTPVAEHNQKGQTT